MNNKMEATSPSVSDVYEEKLIEIFKSSSVSWKKRYELIDDIEEQCRICGYGDMGTKFEIACSVRGVTLCARPQSLTKLVQKLNPKSKVIGSNCVIMGNNLYNLGRFQSSTMKEVEEMSRKDLDSYVGDAQSPIIKENMERDFPAIVSIDIFSEGNTVQINESTLDWFRTNIRWEEGIEKIFCMLGVNGKENIDDGVLVEHKLKIETDGYSSGLKTVAGDRVIHDFSVLNHGITLVFSLQKANAVQISLIDSNGGSSLRSTFIVALNYIFSKYETSVIKKEAPPELTVPALAFGGKHEAHLISHYKLPVEEIAEFTETLKIINAFGKSLRLSMEKINENPQFAIDIDVMFVIGNLFTFKEPKTIIRVLQDVLWKGIKKYKDVFCCFSQSQQNFFIFLEKVSQLPDDSICREKAVLITLYMESVKVWDALRIVDCLYITLFLTKGVIIHPPDTYVDELGGVNAIQLSSKRKNPDAGVGYCATASYFIMMVNAACKSSQEFYDAYTQLSNSSLILRSAIYNAFSAFLAGCPYTKSDILDTMVEDLEEEDLDGLMATFKMFEETSEKCKTKLDREKFDKVKKIIQKKIETRAGGAGGGGAGAGGGGMAKRARRT
jgi:hypothetical protein